MRINACREVKTIIRVKRTIILYYYIIVPIPMYMYYPAAGRYARRERVFKVEIYLILLHGVVYYYYTRYCVQLYNRANVE